MAYNNCLHIGKGLQQVHCLQPSALSDLLPFLPHPHPHSYSAPIQAAAAAAKAAAAKAAAGAGSATGWGAVVAGSAEAAQLVSVRWHCLCFVIVRASKALQPQNLAVGYVVGHISLVFSREEGM